jgi:DNA-binding LacI/PurR family transcriptional regulator
VSKVLNGRTDVAPETRRRLAKVLRGHGYQVASWSDLGVVDLLIGDLASPWSEELIRGAVAATAEEGLAVLVSRVTSDAEYGRALTAAVARGSNGILCVLHVPTPAQVKRLETSNIPLVVIDPPAEPTAELRSVGTTNWHGGLTAATHLAELGHRRIGVICGPPELWSCRARLDGYRSALLRAGLPVDERLIGSDKLLAGGGRSQAHRLLDLDDPPTAIMAANDAQAFGVLQALAEHGLAAPRDISVIGFDDLPIATWATPPLTTIRQPLAAMAATAFRMLRTAGTGNVTEPHHLELDTSLVIRKSTAPPP